MKAKPVINVRGEFVECAVEQATHVTLNFPGPSGVLTLPVILRGTREGTNCWTWNGDVEKPTLKPSVKTTGHNFVCHTWVNDGFVQFLGDTTHELVGQTVALLEVPADELETEICALVAAFFYQKEPVELATTFQEDLGADDLDLVELAIELEYKYVINLTDEEMAQCQSVRDMVALVKRKK